MGNQGEKSSKDMASSRNLEHRQVLKRGNQVSGRVSASCWHATPVAGAPWKPIFSHVKFSKLNQGKGHEMV